MIGFLFFSPLISLGAFPTLRPAVFFAKLFDPAEVQFCSKIHVAQSALS